MTGESEFIEFLGNWAKAQNKVFVVESFDGDEMDETIDGVRAADVWGWLVPEGTDTRISSLVSNNSDDYGCVEWSIEDGRIALDFRKYE